jgi:hypothetical protein
MIKKATILLSLTTLIGCGEKSLEYLDLEADNRIPGVAFDSPPSGQTATDASFTILTTFSNVQILDTWNVYYVSDVTPNKSGAIAVNLPVTSRTIQWDTTQLPAGEYYFYAELNANDSIITATSRGSILITHDQVDTNSSPVVSLSTPNGGEVLTTGSSVNIAWTASDSDGDSLTADLDYSADGGNTWSTLVEGVSESSYTWDIDSTFTPGINYRVRVTVQDDSGAKNSAVSRKAFSIY